MITADAPFSDGRIEVQLLHIRTANAHRRLAQRYGIRPVLYRNLQARPGQSAEVWVVNLAEGIIAASINGVEPVRKLRPERGWKAAR